MKKWLKVALGVVGVALLAWLGYALRWNAYDWWQLRNYTPPARVASLADQTTMTPYARRLFYVYHPELNDAASFNRNCRVNHQSIVLGCTVNLRGIYLYNVTDSQLNGIMQVTAAYEMLHVGYSRLSVSERQHIDQLVAQEFNKIKGSQPKLLAEEQSYLRTEGQGAVANELHSMMGTEVAQLPPELEQYYSRYFSNRQAIIALKNQYETAFTSRQQAVAQDDQQLNSWQQTIVANQANLKTQATAIDAERARLQSLADNNQAEQYNAAVPSFNASVDAYNQLAQQTKALIDQYNQLLSQRNSLALEVNKLTQTISSQPVSSLRPASTQAN